MEDFSKQQLFFMRRAIALGELGRNSAPPNPWVGCVLVKNEQVIGEGYHQRKGERHAELIAIHSARTSPEGCDVYVTLEPCCHYGETPPCVQALIKHKVARVFVALLDPDTRVSGGGVRALRQAGIPVYEGLGRKEAEISLCAYLYQRTHGLPWVVSKSAATLDGQVADQDEDSQWITCKEARLDVGRLRAASQAVIVGSHTVIKDNPSLTARDGCALYPRQPLRVVVDSSGVVSPKANVFHDPSSALYVTTTLCAKEHRRAMENAGVDVLVTTPVRGRVHIGEVYAYLASKQCVQLLVEGGATLQTSFLKENLVHSIVLYVGGKVLGNQNKPLFHNLGLRLSSAQVVVPISSEIIGSSLKMVWHLRGE